MTGILETALLVEVALLAAVAALAFGRAITAERRRAWIAPLADEARRALRALVLHAGSASAAEEALRRLPVPDRIGLVAEIGRDLAGEERERVGLAAERAGLGELARSWCRDRRWWLRLGGVRLLALLGTGAEIVPPLLADLHPLVRAEAAFWAGECGRAELAPRLVEMVEREGGLPRASAQNALLRMGTAAVHALAARLADGRAPREILFLAAAAPDARFLDGALDLALRGSDEERVLAIELLAALGGDDAARRIAAALADPDPSVRAAAAAGAGRLGLWAAAPRLATLLGDAEWEVRRSAGLALRHLGAPGELYLREVAESADALGADLASEVLALSPHGTA